MTELILDLGKPAHGGHFVARHEGRVIFVRHGVPGEKVRAVVTEEPAEGSFWRADVVEVLEESAEFPGARRPHFWAEADSLAAYAAGAVPIGGAEFGHLTEPVQRRLKAQVLSEQLERLAGIHRSTDVEQVAGEADGLGWRTRVGFAVTDGGRVGMHAHRSETVRAVADMPLATQAIRSLGLFDLDAAGLERIDVAAPADGDGPLVLLAGDRAASQRFARELPDGTSAVHWAPPSGRVAALRGRSWLSETALERTFRVSGEGFWQIHRLAPQTLTDAVDAFLEADELSGLRSADLYAGAGLFTALLADRVGERGQVLSVEGSPVTSKDAARNFARMPQVTVIPGRVDRVLAAATRQGQGKLDLVVLDPPRAGAGKGVVRQVVDSGARAAVYVSCDPASFARDVGYFTRQGWELAGLRAFDLYPQTHHLETVALLRPQVP
ncbi:class I SAM-dependent RNA methyltransferase [Psychromicrobium xiongbiense]|uniref:class I SAM-dependent RNA methyltransferase n=1 Tax=Psychromicrobium xiongbiense TaxID=3051184 RepID=UPI0025575943|nr:class I SAM-dependent RNA methyltransferase [Psychromicrobium sp. YIM S02556]